MLSKIKWTGVLLGVVASACLASRRARTRRDDGGTATLRDDGTGTRPGVRAPRTRLDAGGQTA